MLGGHTKKKKSNKKIARGNFFRTPGVRIFKKLIKTDLWLRTIVIKSVHARDNVIYCKIMTQITL